MKKILIIITLIALGTSCKKDLTSLNVDQKRPAVVPSASLFASGQRNFSDALASSNVNIGIFRLLAQQWTETTYTDESNYDLNTRAIPDNWWNRLYRDVLEDLNQAKTLVPSEGQSAAVQANQLAAIDIMQVYTYSVLVNTFGNVPYSESLNIANVFPKYDDGKAIYEDLLKRLNADIAAISPVDEGYGSSDLIYGGDMAAWLKFANSIKLKLAMTIADDDPQTARTAIEQAAPGAFTSNADNAKVNYTQAPPNTNPVWTDLVQSGRKDFVAANTVVDVMNGLDDPRRPYYFTFDATGVYTGGEYGASNNYATYSKPAGPLLVAGSVGKITNPDFPSVILDYSQIEFLRAEAVERGFNIGAGTAQSHYDAAITASIEWWTGSTATAAAYLAMPEVNYATAAGDWKEKIGIQKWLALYNQGFDAWTEVRRLDYPKLEAPEDAQSDYPQRFTYPVTEQNVNTGNYNQAASAMGGDVVESKIFWDKY
ncbi:SusD/RagB family nutrient-binding outer membrane lipoprotein [Pedobacter sp. HMF7647]|uniref:SusD/RagB family nutrient-binding outer membrane lipoprotein n=1 Tax=Hufsiella arboris TaxID=2695275 RepID=A0A7K1Y5L3_9SPHI|nr:SusD/RagB family nutrient-binding outer membrane lipoprotein [Hufsiella arboris]MXV49874.1 SusD/RagB family nutrient-binding outer membrane lipoprotein [Hufsiella arboris]